MPQSCPFVPIVNQTQYCYENCYELIKAEVAQSFGFDLRIMLFFLFLAIGGAMLNYFIFYKKGIDDPNVQKFIRVYIMLSFYLSIIFLSISLKLSLGIPGLFG